MLDPAVANGGNAVSMLLGDGDGNFRRAGNFGTGSSPGSVAMGDFNGDGRPDLAVANGGFRSGSGVVNDTPQTPGRSAPPPPHPSANFPPRETVPPKRPRPPGPLPPHPPT